MDSPNKRVLTDELREADSASDQFFNSSSAGTEEDVLQRLRSVGARARKSVLEGYRTTPSSFSRAQSTGSIFRSMNDTLHQVYSNIDRFVEPTQNNNSRKRSRSVTDYDIDGRGGITNNSETLEQQNTANVLENPVLCRPIKPLRRRAARPLLETRSLPAGAFSFGNDHSSEIKSLKHVADKVEEEEEEEEEGDWTQANSLQFSAQAFEPMIF